MKYRIAIALLVGVIVGVFLHGVQPVGEAPGTYQIATGRVIDQGFDTMIMVDTRNGMTFYFVAGQGKAEGLGGQWVKIQQIEPPQSRDRGGFQYRPAPNN